MTPMLPRDVKEFLALDYLEDVDPTLIYLASPYAHSSVSGEGGAG